VTTAARDEVREPTPSRAQTFRLRDDSVSALDPRCFLRAEVVAGRAAWRSKT
jgi:hypothetical protein